jgi:aldehyde:ferredoxin oxidoreductase
VWHRDALLPGYYAARGWDEQGRPRQEKLDELGIG